MLRRMLGLVLLLLVPGLLALGCAPRAAPEKTYPVQGTVTLDEKPLDSGEILFRDPAKGYVRVIPIAGGSFRGEAKAGNLRVEINAYREEKVTPMPGDPEQITKVNYLDKKYNFESTLTADVKAEGPNQFKFDLSTK